MNAKGQVAYQGDTSVFLGSNTNPGITIVASAGDNAPGGGKFISAASPSINSKGQIAFAANTLAPSISGIYLYSSGKFQVLATEGMATNAGVIYGLAQPSLNSSGDCAFATSRGIFLASKGSVTKIAESGDVSPEGDRYSSLSHPSINANGRIVFSASLQSGNTGFYVAFNGLISKVVNSGDPAPNGGVWLPFYEPASLNDAGDVAFAGFGNGGTGNASGIYLYHNGALQLALPSPFTASNGVVGLGANNPWLNNAGQISVISAVQTGNSQSLAIFVTSGNSVIEVLDPSKTAPDGLTYLGAASQMVNDVGQVAYSAWLVQQVKGVYVYSPSRTVRVGGKNAVYNRPISPVFTFPSATSITQDGRALLLDFTSPGGIGFFLGAGSPNLNQIQTMAHLGQLMPSGGVIDQVYDTWKMNDTGILVFDAGNSMQKNAIVMSTNGVLSNVATVGDASPDGGTFLGFSSPAINRPGHVVFGAYSTSTSGLYLSSNGTVSSLPGGIAVQVADNPSINDSDQVAFFSEPWPQPYGIYLVSNGRATPIALDGDAAPGGDNFSLPYPDASFGPILNNRGDIVFSPFLVGGGQGTYLYSNGTIIRIAGPGDATPDGDVFADTYYAWINDAGTIVFAADTYSGDYGVYEYAGGSLITVAHGGTVVPGFGPLLDAWSTPSINASGQIAFSADMPDGTTMSFLATPQENAMTKKLASSPSAKPRAMNRQLPAYLRADQKLRSHSADTQK